MTSTYDFIHDIDEIQRMKLDTSYVEGSSMLDVTIQNVSLDIGSANQRQPTSTNKKGHQQG